MRVRVRWSRARLASRSAKELAERTLQLASWQSWRAVGVPRAAHDMPAPMECVEACTAEEFRSRYRNKAAVCFRGLVGSWAA